MARKVELITEAQWALIAPLLPEPATLPPTMDRGTHHRPPAHRRETVMKPILILAAR